MISSETGAYASSGHPASKDESGIYFPDSIVGALVEEARRTVPDIFEAHKKQPEFSLLETAAPVIRDPEITYRQSKELIIAALTEFDPALGKKAKEIFDAGFDQAAKKGKEGFIEKTKDLYEDTAKTAIEENESRWRLQEVDPGEGPIQRCLPAKSSDSKYNPANPNPHAVIQFQYDNTIGSTIYLAHELGHAIADDYIHGRNGVKFGDNPEYLNEFQAYITQHIMYDYLKRHQNQYPEIARAAEQHYTATMTQNLYQIPVALSAMEAQKGTPAESKALLENWFGPDWKQYKPAQEIFNTIKSASSEYVGDTANEKLDATVERLHSRPIGILLASGLVKMMPGLDQQTRHGLTETLLGRNGIVNIVDVLYSAGIKSEGEVRKFAGSAVKAAGVPMSGHQAKPAQRNNALQSGI